MFTFTVRFRDHNHDTEEFQAARYVVDDQGGGISFFGADTEVPVRWYPIVVVLGIAAAAVEG